MAGTEAGDATTQRIIREAIEYIDTSIQSTRPELSYVPDNPRLQPADYGFVHRTKLYLRLGTDAEVSLLIQKAIALYRQHYSREVFFASSQVTGREGPLLVLSFFATDVQDYYAHRQKTLEQLGEDLLTIRTQVAALCRRIENINYTIRRDLGYQPSNQTRVRSTSVATPRLNGPCGFVIDSEALLSRGRLSSCWQVSPSTVRVQAPCRAPLRLPKVVSACTVPADPPNGSVLRPSHSPWTCAGRAEIGVPGLPASS